MQLPSQRYISGKDSNDDCVQSSVQPTLLLSTCAFREAFPPNGLIQENVPATSSMSDEELVKIYVVAGSIAVLLFFSAELISILH